MNKDFIALSRRSIKPEDKNNQLCNDSYCKLENISLKSSSLVLLLLIFRLVKGFISVHADLCSKKYALRLRRCDKQSYLAGWNETQVYKVDVEACSVLVSVVEPVPAFLCSRLESQ